MHFLMKMAKNADKFEIFVIFLEFDLFNLIDENRQNFEIRLISDGSFEHLMALVNF